MAEQQQQQQQQQQQEQTYKTRAERPKNVIHVSYRNRPIRFYVGLTKKLLTEFPEVELTALGNAMSIVVQVAEILKRDGFCNVSRLQTSTVETSRNADGQSRPKAKLHAFIVKGPRFDELRAEEEKKDAEKKKEKETAMEDDQQQQQQQE